MRRNLQTIGVPFPSRLMSSARTPTAMTTDFAREVLNMYALQNGAGTKRNGFVSYGGAVPSGTIVRLFSYIPVGGSLQILAVTDSGKIMLQNGSGWTEVYSGIDTTGLVRGAYFDNRLILTNGVDDMLEWDGSTMSKVYEYVQDLGASLTYVSATSFTIESDAALYLTGYKLRARLGGGNFVETTISSVSGSGTITVTVADSVLTAALDEVYFEARPPKFSFIYAAHDRLWGIGTGVPQVNGYSANADRMRVFYTDGVLSATDWYDAAGSLQSIGLSDKAGLQDELVGMAVKDNFTLFFGRNHCQIWQGVDPTATGDMSWAKTIPVGAIHGDLIYSLPNDVAFFTRGGVRTLSRILQTEQLDVGDIGSEVDPTIASAIQGMYTSTENLRDVHTFAYEKQGWFGFKPYGRSLVYQLNNATAGWSQFDGFFEDATAFLNLPDGSLLCAVGAQLYQYDESVYADDGNAITSRWWTPWLTFTKSLKRWANKYLEVLSEQGAALVLQLKRYKNYDSSSYRDLSASLSTAADYWEESDWDNALWDNGAVEPAQVRDKCVADALSYAVEVTSTTGPFTVYGLKLHGRNEQ